MAPLANDNTGPNEDQQAIMDLDAGTGMPRPVMIAGAMLVIAGIVFLLIASSGDSTGRSAYAGQRTATSTLTMPALQPFIRSVPDGTGPVRDGIGPTSLTVAPVASLPLESLAVSSTHDS